MTLRTRYEADRIAERVAQVAAALDAEPKGEPLVLVAILKGASFFLCDLARQLAAPAACEYISVLRAEGPDEILQIDFSTGFPFGGRSVLLLKDVVYSGVVENYLMDHLRAGGAASVRLAAILDKPSERRTAVSADFSLFSTKGGTFVGYGMSQAGRYAHLPYIAEVMDEQ